MCSSTDIPSSREPCPCRPSGPAPGLPGAVHAPRVTRPASRLLPAPGRLANRRGRCSWVRWFEAESPAAFDTAPPSTVDRLFQAVRIFPARTGPHCRVPFDHVVAVGEGGQKMASAARNCASIRRRNACRKSECVGGRETKDGQSKLALVQTATTFFLLQSIATDVVIGGHRRRPR